MRAKKYLFLTLKETSKNFDCISHNLMLRAGIIRKSSSGIYVWLPTGLRILNNIINIVKKEMENSGAIEISMPILQKKVLWKDSGRLKTYGDELFKLLDRKKNTFILGPTHEELITYFMKNELQSYKQLPLLLYQIQTKFRDEIRSSLGTIRTKEFIMKDAYSFHINSVSLKKTYKIIYQTYMKIFEKLHLKCKVVQADSGGMGGLRSHEFLASNENNCHKNTSKIFKNFEINNNKYNSIKILKNNNLKKNLSDKPNSLKNNIVQTLLVRTKKNNKHSFVALLIRKNDSIDEKKLLSINILSCPLKFASNDEVIKITGTTMDFVGPIGLNLPVIADHSVINLKNFTIGSNIENKYFNNINWNKDISTPKSSDITRILENELNVNNTHKLQTKNSIEIAHIFQIGKKYCKIMDMKVQDKTGKKNFVTMGCYGIGITRVVAAIIEQNYDRDGIVWPSSIAPFKIAVLPVNFYKSNLVKKQSEKIYNLIKINNIEVILDDREQSFGTTLSEMELIGVPYSIIISEKLLKNNTVEYRTRCQHKIQIVNKNEIVQKILKDLQLKN